MNATNQERALGVFTRRQQAEQALSQLNASGFSMDSVSVIAKQADEDEDKQLSGVAMSDHVGNQSVKTGTGIVQEALTYSTWGTVLVGLTSLAIPGIGPIIAAGSLGAALVAMTGSTGISALSINNLVKALTDLGISQEEARVYSDRLLQGRYLIVLEGSHDQISQAETIFNEQGVQDWSLHAAV
jgi:hypothetical protein